MADKEDQSVLELEQAAQAFASVPIFEQLSPFLHAKLAAKAERVTVPAGATMAREGDTGEELCVILEGEARVRIHNHVVATLSTGDFFGEMSLLDGEPRSAAVAASTDSVVLVLKRGDFLELLAEDPEMSRVILQQLSRRLRAATEARWQ